MKAYAQDSESYTKPVFQRNLNSKQIVADYSRAIKLRPTWDYAYISRAFAYYRTVNRFIYQSKWELKSVLGAAVPKSDETLKSLVSAVREVLRT